MEVDLHQQQLNSDTTKYNASKWLIMDSVSWRIDEPFKLKNDYSAAASLGKEATRREVAHAEKGGAGFKAINCTTSS